MKDENSCSSMSLLDKIKFKSHFGTKSIVKQSMNPFKKNMNSNTNKVSKDGRSSFKEFFAFKGLSKREKNQEFNAYHVICNDLQIGNNNNSTTQLKPIHTGDSTDATAPVTDNCQSMTVVNYYGDFTEPVGKNRREEKKESENNIRKLNEKKISNAAESCFLNIKTVDISDTSNVPFLKMRLPNKTQRIKKNKRNNIDDYCSCPESLYSDYCGMKTKRNRKQKRYKKSSSKYRKSSSLKCDERYNKIHDNEKSGRFRKQIMDQKQQKNTSEKKSSSQDLQNLKNMSCQTKNPCKNTETSMGPKIRNLKMGTSANSGYQEKNKDKCFIRTGNNNSSTTPTPYAKNINAVEKKIKQVCDKSSSTNCCCQSLTEDSISTTTKPFAKNVNAVKMKTKQILDKSSSSSCYCESFTENNIHSTLKPYAKNMKGLKKKNKQMRDKSSSASSCSCESLTKRNISITPKPKNISALLNKNKKIYDKSSSTVCCCESLTEKNITKTAKSKNVNEKKKKMFHKSSSSTCCCETPTEDNIRNKEIQGTTNSQCCSYKTVVGTSDKNNLKQKSEQECEKTEKNNKLKTKQLVEKETSKKKDGNKFCNSSIANALKRKMKKKPEAKVGCNFIPKKNVKKNIPKVNLEITQTGKEETSLTVHNKRPRIKLEIPQKSEEETSLTAQNNSHYVTKYIRQVSSVCSCDKLTEQEVPKYCLIGSVRKRAKILTPREKCKKICNKRRLIVRLNVPALDESLSFEKNGNNESPQNVPVALKSVVESTKRHAKQEKDNPVRDNVCIENTFLPITENNMKIDNAYAGGEKIDCPVRCIEKEYTIRGKKRQFSCENKQQFCIGPCLTSWLAPPPYWMTFKRNVDMKAPRNYNINIDLKYLKSSWKFIIIALTMFPCLMICMCCIICLRM